MGVKVQVKEGIAPSAPGALSATASDTPSVALSWGAATDNLGVASYKITRNGTAVGTVNAPATSWTDTTAKLGATYTYGVAAVDTSGNVGSAVTKGVTMPPDPNPSPASPTPDPSASPAPTEPTPAPTPTPGSDATPNPDDQSAPTAPEPLDGTAGTTTVSLSGAPRPTTSASSPTRSPQRDARRDGRRRPGHVEGRLAQAGDDVLVHGRGHGHAGST